MNLIEIPYPNIDPVLFQIGPVAIRWYGLAYVVAFLIAHQLLRRLVREGRLELTESGVGDLLFWTMIGTVLGGRLGYILFYDLRNYVDHPAEIIKIWHGGLSFHGGISGVAIAIILFARKRKASILNIMDCCSAAAPPGIFCVRIANFINAELWGRPTDVPWAMVFPNFEPDALPRHPSTLYEAFLEGLVLFAVVWSLRKSAFLARRGALASLFVFSYGFLRFLVEFTREPDRKLGFVLGPFSMGQILCAVMMLIGGIGLARTTGRPTKNVPVS